MEREALSILLFSSDSSITLVQSAKATIYQFPAGTCGIVISTVSVFGEASPRDIE